MPTLNRETLMDEFDMSEDDTIIIEPETEQEETDPCEIEYNAERDKRNILKENIENANVVLDRIKEEIHGGNFEPRMIEVAGQIINSITTASKELITDENYNRYLDLRSKMVDLKAIEVKHKVSKGKNTNVTNQNLFIGSREDMLKLLQDTKKIEPEPEKNVDIEQNKEE